MLLNVRPTGDWRTRGIGSWRGGSGSRGSRGLPMEASWKRNSATSRGTTASHIRMTPGARRATYYAQTRQAPREREREMASAAVASVFEQGKLRVQSYGKKQTDVSSPPKPLLIVTPTQAGTYPVILFLHGFALQIRYYRQMLEHIASHGYIAVAPQLPLLSLPTSNGDIESAAEVTNWLSGGLQAVLPRGVQPNLLKLALAGHSKGGHSAFALALKKCAKTTLDFSVLVAVDPVAGSETPLGPKVQISPRILTYKANSFDIDMPVLVVGSGLGEQKALPVAPPCAPMGLSHGEFFKECKPPCSYFVVKDYGHLDMLDDDAPGLVLAACKCGESRGRDLMRRSIAGLVVAFLEAYLDGNRAHLDAIVSDPGVSPATLDPAEEKGVVRMVAVLGCELFIHIPQLRNGLHALVDLFKRESFLHMICKR